MNIPTENFNQTKPFYNGLVKPQKEAGLLRTVYEVKKAESNRVP